MSLRNECVLGPWEQPVLWRGVFHFRWWGIGLCLSYKRKALLSPWFPRLAGSLPLSHLFLLRFLWFFFKESRNVQPAWFPLFLKARYYLLGDWHFVKSPLKSVCVVKHFHTHLEITCCSVRCGTLGRVAVASVGLVSVLLLITHGCADSLCA